MFKIRKNRGGEIDIEDISIDSVIQKNHKNSLIASQRKETTIGERAFVFLFISFVLIIFVLIITCVVFQFVNHSKYEVKAEKNRYIFNELNTQRGVIYDTNFNQLSFNNCKYNLVIDKEEVNEASYKILSNILQININELKNINTKELSEREVILIKTRATDLKGISLEKKNIRTYEDSLAFSHILGYVSKDDGVGEDGIEKQYEEILKENPGVIKYERDVNNNILSREIVEEAHSGESLILNIDKGLQEKSAEVLKKVVDENNGTGGVVIIMNPKTGAILSLVSYPSYDNNLFSSNFTQEEYDKMLESNISFFNRAISGEYPIGSTIKPMLSSAFLEEDIIDPDTNIMCEGGIKLNDGTFKKDWTTHGPTNMYDAIAESCDVYFYVLGGGYKNIKGLGIDKIGEYLLKYGFGKKTGIDLPSEEKGFIPTPEWKEKKFDTVWYPGDTYNISIGQGYLKATPLQVLIATSAIANGGKLLKPQIIKSVVDNNKNVVKEYNTEVISSNFIDNNNLEIVKKGMRQTVTSEKGSAPSLQTLPIEVAVKTGTAETGTGNTYHNWMTLFGPYEDPEISMIVLTEHIPNFSGTTHRIVREILEWYYDNKTIDKNGNA